MSDKPLIGKSYFLYLAGFNFTTLTFLIYIVGVPFSLGFILGMLAK